MRVEGIDVSHWNGTIKWGKVYDAGYKFVFIKATQGTRFVDRMFWKNAKAAHDAGLLTIPYHFINHEPPDLQAAHFAETAKLRQGHSSMLDWERHDGRMPDIKIAQAMGEAIIHQTRRHPVMYHGLYEVSNKTINSWPWFVPKWGPEPRNVKWLFWQDSATKQVPGINGDCDHDWFNGSEEELRDWYENGTLPRAVR